MTKINKLLLDLDKLNLPKDSYTIVGSGPIGIRWIREVGDLDLIVKKEIFDKLLIETQQDTSKHEYWHLVFDEIELGYTCQDSEEKAIKVILESEIINWYPFAKLEYIIERKKEKNREKDKRDIILIMEYLKH